MAEQDWLRPQVPVEATGAAWRSKETRQFELRPLSLGEILDRTFALYRSRFWLFAGISMIAAAVNVVVQGISLATAQKMASHMVVAPANPVAALANFRAMGTASVPAYIASLLFVLVSAITHAATALAMTRVYLGKTIDVREALGSTMPRWYRWIGIALWQAGSFAWIPVVAVIPGLLLLGFGARGNSVGLAAIGGVLLFLAIFGGFPAGFILYLRNSLAVPAAVTEGLTIRPAMRRSKVLAAGAKGRIFVVLLIALSLLEVVGILQSPATFLVMLAPNKEHYLARIIALLVTFVGHTAVAPIALIGLTLVYFDQRVRKEALDLELLLEGARIPANAGSGASLEHGFESRLESTDQARQPESYAP